MKKERRLKNGGGDEKKRNIRRFFRRHLSVTLLSICISAFFVLIALFAKPLDPVKRAIKDFSFTDIYYEIQKETSLPDTCRVITIVDMTKLTNRTDIAALLAGIEAQKPKVIGLDVCFDNEGEDFEGNDSLISVATRYRNIVYSVKMLEWAGDSIGWTKSIHSFFHEMVPLTEGTTNMPRALYDNMKRNVPVCELYEGKWVPSFVTQVSNLYAGRDVVGQRTSDVKINFSPMVFRVLLPEEVASHPELIEDQIVLVGAMYEEADRHWTPVGKIAGVELLAYGVQSILYSNEIKETPFFLLCIISLAIIFFVEVLQQWYINTMERSNSIFVRHIIGSSYVMSMLTFLFTSVLLGFSFLVFKLYGLSFNLAWALSVITFLGTSRSMYTALTNYFKARREKTAAIPVLYKRTQKKKKMNLHLINRLNQMLQTVRNRLLTVFLLGILCCHLTVAQKVVVYRVVGKVTQTVQGRQVPLKMNTRLDYKAEISIPYGGKVEMVDEAQSTRLILKKPGKGSVKALSAGAENSVSRISAQYLAYVKKQMTNKNLVSQQRYTDFATVTREIDSVAPSSKDRKIADQPEDKALSLKERYNRLSRQSQQKYISFREECNRKYTDFVRKAWEKYSMHEAVTLPEEPRVEPQRVPGSEEPQPLPLRDDQRRDVKEEKPLPGNIGTPRPVQPVEPIKEVEESEEDRQYCGMPFTFYGTPLQVRIDESRRIDLGEITPDRVADALQYFSGKTYDNLLYDCLKIREEHKLCDWAYLLMLKALTEQYSGAGTDESALLLGYLYYQSGYRVRFATDGKRLYLLVASDHVIFSKGYYTVKGETYYPVEDVKGPLSICEAAFPKERTLSLYISEQPVLGSENTETRKIISRKYPDISVETGVNKNLLDFYSGYPSSYVGEDFTTRWAMYANTPMDENIQRGIYTALSEKLAGMSQLEAVNRLLDFVQTGFVYEYDEKVWGEDRAFFAEETLHYPFCDCEDRAILFTRLVRDILHLECVLVYYPGHLAAAVHFDEQPGGTFYTAANGKNYTLCDPTYIGAGVGMEMPQFEQSEVILIHIKP